MVQNGILSRNSDLKSESEVIWSDRVSSIEKTELKRGV
jgi:hypothetical protein